MRKRVVGWGCGWEGVGNKSENLGIYLGLSKYLALGLGQVILLGFLVCKTGKVLSKVPSLLILKCMETFLSTLNNRFNFLCS